MIGNYYDVVFFVRQVPWGSSKVTAKALFHLTRSLLSLFSGQKVTFGVAFELLGGSPPESPFYSLLSYFEFFGLRGPVAGSHDHKETHPQKPPTPINATENSWANNLPPTEFTGKREDSLPEQLRKLFAQTLFIGVWGLVGWASFPGGVVKNQPAIFGPKFSRGRLHHHACFSRIWGA